MAEKSTDDSTAAPRARETVKLGVRLLEAVDLPLRRRGLRQGQLAGTIAEAISTSDLETVRLVELRGEPKAPITTIRLLEPVFRALNKVAEKRDVSLNLLINSAVADWLTRQQRAVRYRREG